VNGKPKKPPASRPARGLSRFSGRRAAALVPQSRMGGPMLWVVAIMTALTVIAAAGGLALANLASEARAELSGGLTVQILEPEPEARNRAAETALAILANREDVASARRVSDQEIEELLAPWLGEGEELGELVPVPALIDARLHGPVTERRVDELRAQIEPRVPSVRIDAQSGWLQPVFEVIETLQWLAVGLVALLAATSTAAVFLASRSALGANRETIEIVHLLGGTDGQIARIFQNSIARDAILGGVAGLALGVTAVLLLARQFSGLDSGMVSGSELHPFDWAAIAAIPVIGLVLAILTARVTVFHALRQVL
jgi:cell division transport system permease protein